MAKPEQTERLEPVGSEGVAEDVVQVKPPVAERAILPAHCIAMRADEMRDVLAMRDDLSE